jgi:hypothetical protein
MGEEYAFLTQGLNIVVDVGWCVLIDFVNGGVV